MADLKPIRIDGSQLEGGGQILRNAITLSAVKNVPVVIYNIRAGRKKPGLMEQHLKGLELVKSICNAKVKGGHLGSTEVEFCPGPLKGGTYHGFVRTAGSISLLLQIALPCALLADSNVQLILRGGTNAEMAPQIDYIIEVFRPILNKLGAGFNFDLVRRGYYPKGGGEVVINVNPVKEFEPINLVDQGQVTAIYGWSFVAGVLPLALAHRLASGAIEVLNPIFKNVQIERYKESPNVAPDNCAGIVLVAETSTGCYIGGSGIGNRNILTEETGKKAGQEIADTLQIGACVDKYAQDQLIIFMALARGESRIRVGEVTLHTKTAIFVAELLTSARFSIVEDDQSNIIQCTGI